MATTSMVMAIPAFLHTWSIGMNFMNVDVRHESVTCVSMYGST